MDGNLSCGPLGGESACPLRRCELHQLCSLATSLQGLSLSRSASLDLRDDCLSGTVAGVTEELLLLHLESGKPDPLPHLLLLDDSWLSKGL